jgi:hypothetical protein
MAINIEKLKKRGTGKGAPPPPAATTTNLSKPASGKKVPLQLNIDRAVKREYEIYCIEQDVSMSDQFEVMFRNHRAKHG